ncbi:hypothetical protein ICJ33_18515 [Pseudomonas simiae]|jgi:hypothetical protein|uniref:Uncharacterized protein n=1 Tax=Pseudomonas simiae TaxID=321846 RepID=A0A1N7TZ40_9PSED|nr:MULTISPECIES: hypothetical protein [Pseudomonas]VVO18441.1 hypothetical protein PS708_04012 [Pseudomonas fluorescens]AIB37440.1 hypothetical protein PS417_17990 [Pseudomonas simiae]AJP53208.1 hypothetical protein PF1751_v1c35080 [Pseudomonas simiae]AJZ97236.1 hypothetical protein PFLUOLIPICF7_18350 [Pseudomonas simiae]KIQ08469.1 hypothetical protein RU03_18935 [Pseudomonas simiae]
MDEQKVSNTPASRLSAAWLWRLLKRQSLPIMLLLFALFYSNGYAYLETYNKVLGVPVNRLGYDTYHYVVYGGNDILVKLAALLIFTAAVLVFACLMYFTENPDRVLPTRELGIHTRRYRMLRRLEKSYRKATTPISGALLISLLAFFAWIIWSLAYAQSMAHGKLRAYEEIRDCKPSILQLNNLDVVTACIVGESDDMLYLVEKHREGGEIQFQKRRVPKDSVRSTTGPTTVLKKPD